MNKTAIKNFAVWARNKLIADIKYKAGLLGITEKVIKSPLTQSTNDVQFFDIGTKEPFSISGIEMDQRDKLAAAINNKAQQSDYQTAYQAVIEEVAYTWFNRLIAVRFMEVNDYLPSRIRVLSSESAGKNEPDLVTNPFDAALDFTPYEKDRIVQLKNDNQLDELFRMLFIKQCNSLNAILPNLFEKTCDYTELLLNVAFTDKDGLVYHLVNDIPEDDFREAVEIIGWMYQYYNTELNEIVYDGNMAKSRITKELLPAATTIYTPDWVVQYLVENSLGRLWLEGHLNNTLKSEWKYYLDEAEQHADVQKQLEAIREEYKTIKPEDIKVIDPCMGSGHILVYAFDVLMQIYESYGYSKQDAAKSIVEHNIYGLDIDNRAYQLAYFAVMMKARQYSRRILNGKTDCHVYSIHESNDINREQLHYFGAGMEEMERNIAIPQIHGLLDALIDAKEYGSILKVDNYDWKLLNQFVDTVDLTGQLSFDTIGIEDTQNQLRLLVEMGAVMAQKYDVVVTNPPYLSNSRMSTKMSDYANNLDTDVKSDLSTIVYKQALYHMCKQERFVAFIMTKSWMFLSNFEHFRRDVLSISNFSSILDLGTELFDGKVGHNHIVAWVSKKTRLNSNGIGVRLSQFCYSRRNEKVPEYFNSNNRYVFAQEKFQKIPGSPIAYWASEKFAEAFDNKLLSEYAEVKKGLSTGDINKYARLWFEVAFNRIGFNCLSCADSAASGLKWFTYIKGGAFRRWGGNKEYIVNWENDGFEVKNFVDEKGKQRSRPQNVRYYFKKGITYSAVTPYKFSARYMEQSVFGGGGDSIVPKNNKYFNYLFAFLNSVVSEQYFKVISPTMNYEVGHILSLPVIIPTDNEVLEAIDSLVNKNIEASNDEWNMFETSWQFKTHPLMRFSDCKTISIGYQNWEQCAQERVDILAQNEEQINKMFLGIYDLKEEILPVVAERDITVRKADLGRDIRSFASYAVGCMFGRYSLDVDGLAYAGDAWNDNKYSTFIPNKDNILPITDEEYFEDDIVGLFIAFVKKVYGTETLEQNIDFIAKALGNRGNTSREIIRNYFINDFFKDHCKIYQKRPIYWLFDSGKIDGFKALIYMHSYDENTIGNLRIDYLHQMQRVYDREIARMQETINNSTNAREVVAAEKRKEKMTKQLKETKEYDEKIAHLALARIAIDLDDGVKINYEKVQTGTDGKKLEVLAKI